MTKHLFQWSVSAFCIAWLGKYLIAPGLALAIYYDDYIELSSACANAMDETWFAEQEQNESLNHTAQVHLLICHDYDKTRKLMLTAGLSEDLLSYLGLKALELDQKGTEALVQQHRFTER
ncbi:hypothetical protein BTA51_23830 [Hahella sp. CCB-MM4]|uniref:TIGR03982 family His-Xaa-Ser system protein n=1 Tax=Hahella sp. (strain CCB-MM4) TaxID=1926491 RepID=UPI000B9A67A0|nr:TIGR03982 family His-Xaa-Ser system protein [Hahella sp. CCB-MM4]OZG70870.1 hypothetical protein BTA51_23830 [Hahella sp. CCB-MM4]